ncbi:ATP-dependent DEAD/H RNA helicase [Trypanosoma cruzi cruzi]|uniref:ATP-dependent RNA helicase n=1 Tax=Trypanosoma cruzi TaxID=5693 RepID=A0A2V2VIM3_TRYCR|nr:ATP-dependent DEAD/H RNA helicase [Trypanosoma cruzi cruzi]PWU96004.1 putative ATP-dependent DEAD/H RNA helicase [Trypanosoma cruzi]
MRRCFSLMWRQEKRLPRRFREVPKDFTEIRSSDSRPLVFTARRPEPLRGVTSLSDIVIDEEALQTSSLQELSQKPVAKLDPERMGLPPHLVQYLHRRFSHEKSSSDASMKRDDDAGGFQGLTMVQARALQHFYAQQDVALCAPTGTGKTFALCLALIARLMRDGPMKLFSVLFLAQNDHLCRQIAQWMREMWWYESDERLVFSATSDLPPNVVYQRLTRELIRDAAGKIVGSADRRPYVCVATPEVFWEFFQRRKQSILSREATLGRKKHSFALTPVLPSIDLVVVDEVDEVLPSTRPDAAGNLLMKELYRFVKYQAPVQLVFTSATLAGSTVNHVRRFLKKSVLESKTSRIFESEIESFSQKAKATGNLSKAIVPDGIQHLFYTADTLEEQRECLAAAIKESGHGMEGNAEPTGKMKILVILPDSGNVDLFVQRVLRPAQPDERFKVEQIGTQQGSCKQREGKEGGTHANSLTTHNSHLSPAESISVRQFILCASSCVRGIDIGDLTHVMILATPQSALDYAHWCGRVGRFGGRGVSIVIMSRFAVRKISLFCDTLDIPFKVKRRHNAIDVDEERRAFGF